MNAVDGVKRPNANEAVFFKRELPPDHPDVLAGKRFRGVNRWPADLPGFREGVLQGSASIRYSRAAIDNALTLLGSKFSTGGGTYVRVRLYNFQEP